MLSKLLKGKFLVLDVILHVFTVVIKLIGAFFKLFKLLLHFLYVVLQTQDCELEHLVILGLLGHGLRQFRNLVCEVWGNTHYGCLHSNLTILRARIGRTILIDKGAGESIQYRWYIDFG